MPDKIKSLTSKFWVTPQSQLGRVLQTSGARHLARFTSDVQSITQPNDIALNDYLALEFNDISQAQAGLTLPSRAHIKALLEFHAQLPAGAPLVLSCYAGISRSTAAAFILACKTRPDIDEPVIANRLRRASPSATPNTLMVSLADEFLGRGGRMVAAVEAIGRGAEAYEGTPFQFDMSAGSDDMHSASNNYVEPHGSALP